MHPRLGLLLGCALVLAAAFGAAPAFAQAKAVQRSVENITMAPLDFLVSPYTAGKSMQKGLAAVETTGGKIMTSIIGYPYYLGTYVVLAGFRETAGLLELPVGLALWPVNAAGKQVELSPFFDTSEARALVDVPSAHFNTKFGGEWLSAH
jgi:hypothetical protein